jgi:hypothetical protein
MRNTLYKKFGALFALVGLMFTIGLSSCKDDDDTSNNDPINVTAVYLENAQATTVKDRKVEFVRLGQTLRLEGSGFTGLKKIYVNGHDTYFNPVFVTDNNVWFQVSGETPTLDAADDVRNTIVLVKNESNQFALPFDVRDAAPSITIVTHTMPVAGDVITIYGTGLYGAASVTFPGNVLVTDGVMSDDEDGRWVTVTVPGGITESGSLLVVCANGGAYSPPYFNFKEGLYQDFDNVNNYSWASGIDDAGTPLTNVIPASGNGIKSQGGYQCFNANGASISANADVRYWTNSANWPNAMLSVIPASTSAAECGVQMDIYVEGAWTSGVIRLAMADGSGADRYSMIYRPWYVNDAVVPYENPGAWYTITLPFSDSEDYAGKTFADVVASMNVASYKQSGPWFHNIGVTDIVEPTATNVKIYFDNIRVVPLNTPTYSDFPDE